MVLITIDSKKVTAFIKGLDSWTESVRGQRKSMLNVLVNRWQSPPVAEAESYVNEASQIETSTANLNEITKGLEDRLKFTVQKNSDGRYTYYLPDDAEDTPKNVKKFNIDAKKKAEKNCAELTDATTYTDGKSRKTGRRIHEILAEMKENETNPIYANSYISYCGGAGEYLDFYSLIRNSEASASSRKDVTARFSNMLATATKDENRGHELARQFGRVVKDNNYTGDSRYHDPIKKHQKETGVDSRIGALNRLLRSEDPIKGPKFGTSFLTSLAEISEDCPALPRGRSLDNRNDIPGAHDPLSGVICAMGRNPEAAANYLAPTDGNGNFDKNAAKARWNKLKNRGIREGAGPFDFTAAMQSASTLRKDPKLGPQSTWISARAIEYAASPKNATLLDAHPEMKKNLSVVLANCREEIHRIANGMSDGELDLAPLDPKSTGSKTLATALYRVMDNEEAAGTISSALAYYGKNEVKGDMPDGSFSLQGIRAKYSELAADHAFLSEIAKQRVDDINEKAKEENDERKAADKSAAKFATSLFSLILAGGATISSGGATVLSFTISGGVVQFAGDEPMSNVIDAIYGEPKKKKYVDVENLTPEKVRDDMQSRAYAEAAQSGVLPGVKLPEGNGDAVKYRASVDKHGKEQWDHWVKKDANGNNVADLPPVISSDLNESIHDWKKKALDAGPSTVKDGFLDIDAGIQSGAGAGKDRAKLSKST